jgi:hypothetical protein
VIMRERLMALDRSSKMLSKTEREEVWMKSPTG